MMSRRTTFKANKRPSNNKLIRCSPSTTDESESEEISSFQANGLQTIETFREIFRLGLRFKIPIDTIHLAIAWAEVLQSIDCLEYSKGGDEVPKPEKLAIIFVALSCKFNEYRQISITDLAYKYGRRTRLYFLELEQKILQKLQFEVPENTPSNIFNQYFEEKEKQERCHKLFMKYILNADYHHLGYEFLSKAIVNSLEPQKWAEESMPSRMQIKVISKQLK